MGRLAAGLAQQLFPNERVALVMQNCPQYVELLFACWHAGLCAVPVNAKLHPRELEFILQNSGARLCFASAGLYAALGILTALLEREASGQGQWVQSSLLMSGIALLDFQAARYLMNGEVPPQVGNDHPTSMPTSAYTTADGYINIGASGEGMWVRLCKAIARPELLTRAEFESGANRANNRIALNAELNAALAGKTSDEWIAILNAAGVPCGPIYNMEQVFADPQVQHIQAAAKIKHPILGEIRVVNQAVGLSRTPATMASATPEIGQHTDEVLAEAGYSAAEIASLRNNKVI